MKKYTILVDFSGLVLQTIEVDDDITVHDLLNNVVTTALGTESKIRLSQVSESEPLGKEVGKVVSEMFFDSSADLEITEATLLQENIE